MSDITKRPLRFFNIDLHISVIADVKHILRELYNDAVEIVNWSISGHNWVFNAPTPDVKVINANTWKHIDAGMIDRFHSIYDSYLSEFDGFIVTHSPVFCMLYEKYGKPIILVNSCRYEQPYCWTNNFSNWAWLNAGLKRMADSGQLIAVSNNKADQEYLRRGTGVESKWIPSLCLYTNAQHNPIHNKFVVHGNRSFFPPHPDIIATPPRHTWSDLYSYRGIIHVPYEISTMSLFEQYSAGVPIFLPTYDFHLQCISNGSMYFGSVYCRNANYWKVVSPECRETFVDVRFWLDRADFNDPTNFAYVYFYSSREDLIKKIEAFEDIHKEARLDWIAKRRANTMKEWHKLLTKYFPTHPPPLLTDIYAVNGELPQTPG